MKRILTLLTFVTLFATARAQNDLSVTAITSPVSACALTSTENVTIRIFNFGNMLPAGTMFNVSYTINAGIPVTELVTLAAPLLSNSTFNYTFTTQANLSVAGTYTIDATVSLAGDVNPTNDAFTGYSVTNTAPSVGGTVSGGTNVCVTGNSGTLTLGGNTGNVLRWEYSTDGGATWINISNTTTTQSYLNLTVPTDYRAVVQNGGCALANSSIASMTIDPATVAGTLASNASVCTGTNSGTLTLSGKTGNVVRWEYSTDGGITWNNIANTTTSQTYLNLTITTRYRVLVQSGACASAYSNQVTITVSPTSVGGTVNPATSTVCSGSNSGTLTLTGKTGNVVRWEYSIDGGVTWINIANTTTSQNYTNLTATRLYRVRVQSSPCAATYSSIATINVTTASIGGSISPATSTVCSGLNHDTLILSGQAGTVQQWEYSIDGGTTWNIVANTTDTLIDSNLTQTTMYRVLVQNGGCTPAYSSGATINVDAPSVGGTVSGGVTVCSGSNGGTLTLSGQNGSIVQWESSNDGITWSSIANTTTSNSFSNLTDTTFYHVIVQSGVCPSDTAIADTVIVDPVTVGGTISPATDTVCSGLNSGVLTLVGSTGSVLQWEYSTDGGVTWITISNMTTSQSYNNLTTATIYRALLKSGVCSMAYSAQATISISPQAVGGTLYSDATVCGASNSGTLTLVGFSGSITQWESSIDFGVTWSPIANTSNSFNYLNLVDTTMYRVIVASGVCPTDTSTFVTINVDAPSVGGAVSMDDTVCAGSNSGTLTLSGETGNVVGWEYSIDGGTTWINIANTTTSQGYVNLTQTTQYRARVGNGVCPSITSGMATITVDPMAIGGTINGSATVCATGNGGSLTLAGHSGNIVSWETSTDGGVTWTANGNTTTSETYTNLATTTWYRVIVAGGVCGMDTSSVGVITVDPATAGGTTGPNAAVCASGNNGTIYLTGYTGAVQGWQYSNDGYNWFTVTNTTDSMVYTNLVQTTYYRAIVLSGVCTPAQYSTIDTITVDPIVNGGMISGSTSVCATGNSGVLTLNGYTGSITTWELSTDGGVTWTANGNTTATESYTNLADTTWYRAIVSSGVCGMDTSTTGTIIVDPATVGGTTSPSAIVCAGNNSGTIYLTGQAGAVQGWQYSTDGFNWIALANTTDSLMYLNLSQTTYYRAIVLSGVCTPAQYSSVDTVTVSPLTVPGTISGSAATCEGTGSGSLTLTGYVGTIFAWESSTDNGATWTLIPNNSATQSWSNPTDTTWYHVIVASPGCPIDTSSVGVITMYPKPVAGFTATTVCEGNATFFTDATTLAAGGLQFHNWDFGDNDASVATNPVHTYAAAGTYNVTLVTVSDHNCSDTAVAPVIVNALPIAAITASGNLTLCSGDSVMLSVPSAAQLNYLWNTGDTVNAIYASTAGNYLVTVTNAVTGCTASDSVDVNVLPRPVASAGLDTSVSAGSSVVLLGSGGSFYSWIPTVGLSDPSSATPVCTPPYTVTYTLTVTDMNGCSDTDAVVVTFVKDYNVVISNLITANGDGYNDVWNVQNIEFYPNNKVSIYNRNGMLVYEQEGYMNSWAGTYNGAQLPDGTYYYVLEFTDSGDTVKGAVTIVSGK